ncbi:hypothetical protein C0J52_26359 [Blattella germanica]|nr:hypothetical protein C0J52_26359 [Blattella germanica]
MIGIVTRKEADVGLSAFSMTTDRLSVVDSLPQMLPSRNIVYIQEPKTKKLNWINFFLPFRWPLWICIFFTLVLLAICLTIASRLEHVNGTRELSTYTLMDSFLYVLGSFCGQGQNATPTAWTCRIVYLLSLLVGIIILAAYSAALISFLTVQRPDLPFETLGEFLSDGSYNIFIPNGSILQDFQKWKINRPLSTQSLCPITGLNPLSKRKHHSVLIGEIRRKASSMQQENWKIVFSRVNDDVGIQRNDQADQLVKEAAENTELEESS